MHSAIQARALSLTGGHGHVVFLALDLVAVTQQAREAIVREVEERTGRDIDRELIVGASHTHSGPGRMMDNPVWELLSDRFFPEFTERMISAMADAVVHAMEAEVPAALGYGFGSCPECHHDRRCENPDYKNSTLGVIRVDGPDGQVMALLVNFAVHGTILSPSDHMLSSDVGGGIVRETQELFDHPVTVLFFNAWAGDMSPGDPPVEVPGHAAVEHGGFARIERIGMGIAQEVHRILPGVSTTDRIDVETFLRRVPIDRDVIGYPPDVFPFPYGGVYCGAGTDGACWGEPPKTGIDKACLGFPEEHPAPMTTIIGVARLGGLVWVTEPTEAVTPLAELIMDGVRGITELPDMMFAGYSQDYLGYSLTEEDWWQGGYEASGSIWGPRQGEYLEDRTLDLARVWVQGVAELPWDEPPRLDVPIHYEYEPFVPLPSPAAAGVVSQPTDATEGEVVRFSFTGGSPWFGTPVVSLEREVDGEWAPFLRHDQTQVDSRGDEIVLTLSVDPPYPEDHEESAQERTYRWDVSMPTVRAVVNPTGSFVGRLRFAVEGRIRVRGEQEPGNYELHSEPFTVERGAEP